MRTLVTFRSDAFNISEPKDYFINPRCFGDDLANWLMQELRNRGIDSVGEPQQEDFGWCFTFRVGNTEHDFVVGFRPGDATTEGEWIGVLERKRGFIGSIFGGRARGIQPAAIRIIQEILSAPPLIHGVRWHVRKDFDGGREEIGSKEPLVL